MRKSVDAATDNYSPQIIYIYIYIYIHTQSVTLIAGMGKASKEVLKL